MELHALRPPPDDETFRGTSYTVDDVPSPEAPIDVEYLRAKPHVSRILGMRSQPFELWAAFVLVVPLAGLGFILSGLRTGIQNIHLLERGELTHGKLVARKETNTRINKKPVIELRVIDGGSTSRAMPRLLGPHSQSGVHGVPARSAGSLGDRFCFGRTASSSCYRRPSRLRRCANRRALSRAMPRAGSRCRAV